MTKDEIREISAKLANHEERIRVLEGSENTLAPDAGSKRGKQKTLREVVKGKKFNNGQEQVAVIVGYHEKILNKLIYKDTMPTEWTNTKMTRKYRTTFLKRAEGELVRVHPDGTCDLTQSGEEFFEEFLGESK